MTNYVGPAINDPTSAPTPPDLGPSTTTLTTAVVAQVPDPPTASNVAPVTYPYQAWGQVTTVERETGLRQVPVCGPPGTPCEEIREHAGWARKTITGVAIRTGAHPQFPSSVTGAANETLRRSRVGAFSPQQVPGGVRVYGFVWEYVYDLSLPLLETDSISFGQPPTDAGAAEAVNPCDYLKYLTPPAQPAAFAGQAVDY